MTTTEMQRHSIAASCEALGVPREDWHLFLRWAAMPPTSKAVDALYSYVDVMVADRCRKPSDDLVSKLIEMEVDGEALTADNIGRFVAALVIGAG